MPWGRLDDGLYDHPKLDDLGSHRLAGVGLWTLAISWCNRRLTDGQVPADRIRLLGGSPQLAERLVAAGFFERIDGGYQIHDFLEFNESRETVEARREADRKRKRKPGGNRPDSGPDSTEDSGGTPDGNRPDSGGTPGRTPIHATRDRAGRVPPAAARPGPAHTNTDMSTTPQPPASGGRKPRARDLGPMRPPGGYDYRTISDATPADELPEWLQAAAPAGDAA